MEEAAQIARNLNRDREIDALPALKVLPSENQDSAQLIYWVKVQPKGLTASSNVLIDAHTGKVIANVPNHVSIAPVDVYSADGAPNKDIDPRTGAPLRFNFGTMPKMVSASIVADSADASAQRAAANSQKVLQYYADHHGRNSYDDQGSTTVSIVHAGQNFSNAFWSVDESIMAYGDGDGIHTTDFTKALDVAGHEMTHGVVGATSKLTMFGEAGALNEALADFFGKMIENADDWIIGRGIFLDASMPGFRNLADPGSILEYTIDDEGRTVTTPDPANLKDEIMATTTCNEENDYCYVHANSTIASHTEYLIAQQLGKATAEKLMYAVMTQYLTERSGFRMFRNAIQKACAELLDSNSCDTVNNALATTGLLD
jgi:Zn-dependent metalloprotease